MEEMDDNDSNSSNISSSCSLVEGLTDQEIEMIGISGIVTTSISIIVCVTVILLMILFKKYLFAVQRLIMYLDISILLNVINQLLQRAAYKSIYNNEEYCIGLALFSQYSAYCILLSVTCALFELLLRIVFKKEGGYLEIVYLLVIFVFPFGVSWIPYFFDAYGAVNTFCTVVVSQACESFKTALILEAVLWWTPLYLTIMFALVSYPLFYCIIRGDRKRYSGIIEVDRTLVSERALEEVGYFKWLPLLFIVLDLIPIATMVHDFIRPHRPIVVLWILTAIVKGCQGGIVAVFISLDPKTFKRLTPRQLRSAFRTNVLPNTDIKDYPAKKEKHSDSFEGSSKYLTRNSINKITESTEESTEEST